MIDLSAVNLHVMRYKCGTCDYESSAQWIIHQRHYEEHR